MNYSDYFKINHNSDEVTMDEFIEEAMRTDPKFNNVSDKLNYTETSRITLKNEVLTCYNI